MGSGMKIFRGAFALASAVAGFVVTPVAAAETGDPSRSALDGQQIEQLTGANGTFDAKEGVFKVSVPRTDLRVTAAGVKIPPSMGLTSWAAFGGTPQHTIVMGDLVLTEDQVNPVMSVALESGLEVTALHNHFFWDSPKVMFMHIGGMGEEKALAAGVGKVFAKINQTSGGAGEVPKAQVDPAQTTIDGAKIDAILGKIDIVAIHQHMTGEQPRVLFLHYWGVGKAQDLARGLRSALDRTETKLGAR